MDASTSSLMTSGAAATTGTGKIRLLKKQLEEARMEEQEKLDRMKDLERLVKDLQSQVTNRDDLIARMREDQFSVASFQSGGAGESPFVMSPVENRSPNRSPPPHHQYYSSPGLEDFQSAG